MNKRQKLALWIGVAAAVVMILYPPWSVDGVSGARIKYAPLWETATERAEIARASQAFRPPGMIYRPIKEVRWREFATLDMSLLAMQMMLLAIVTATFMVTTKRSGMTPSLPPAGRAKPVYSGDDARANYSIGRRMNAWRWYLDAWNNYANFAGRSQRAAYWYFALVHLIVVFMCLFVDVAVFDGPILTGLYALATVIPGWSLTVRRLHDAGRSGWWLLVGVIPVLGHLAVLVLLTEDSQSGSNQYGPNPKGGAEPARQAKAKPVDPSHELSVNDLTDRAHQAKAGAENSQPPTEMKLCPFCAEEIKFAAIKCKHCHEFLTEKPTKGADDE